MYVDFEQNLIMPLDAVVRVSKGIRKPVQEPTGAQLDRET